MSWSDTLSYHENVDKFLDSLKDFSKTEDNTYKITKELLNLKHLSTQKVFAKLYLDVFKRLKNDFSKVKFINTKELVEIKYKDELVFSYKPSRYIFIPNVLNKLNTEINKKESQLRDMRDGVVSGNATSQILNNIEKLKVSLLTLYEKENVLREVHEILNKTQEEKEAVELRKKQDRERRSKIIELKKQMKEYFNAGDIRKIQIAAKEIANLNNDYLNNIEKEFKNPQVDRKDFLLIRSPEIVVNNKDIGKKKTKKTAKKTVKPKKTEPESNVEEKKEKKADKKPKKTKKAEQKGSGDSEGETESSTIENKDNKRESQEQIKGGFNLIDHLNNQIGGNNKEDEFERDELSLNIGMTDDSELKEQFGSGNEDKSNMSTSTVNPEPFHTTPPFGPRNNDPNMPMPTSQQGGNASSDVKVVSVSQNAMGGMVPQPQEQKQEQIAGADPFTNTVNLEPDLQSVPMDSLEIEQNGGYEDMTAAINNSYEYKNPTDQNMSGGGAYSESSSPGVFDTTYQEQYGGSNMNSNSTDPFGLEQMPENINVNVTKLP